MSGLWLAPLPLPLHSGLAGHNWFAQILVIALIAGVWLFISGNIARRSAARRQGASRSQGDTWHGMGGEYRKHARGRYP